jgi:hypothetical protein
MEFWDVKSKILAMMKTVHTTIHSSTKGSRTLRMTSKKGQQVEDPHAFLPGYDMERHIGSR